MILQPNLKKKKSKKSRIRFALYFLPHNKVFLISTSTSTNQKGSLYKILAKVLANRIKRVLGKVISPVQSAFVEGRQILDAVLIANEAVDCIIKRKESGLACKLDIEKAYDHLSWEFLIQVLEKMGFGSRWVSWVKWCISTASFSIMVNGSPAGFFQSSRGLRQGDPLSPYLFVIGMEVLSRLLNRAVSGNYLYGCKIGDREGEGSVISHLLYADDTLLFCDANKDQLKYLSWVLMWFEVLSGLRINLKKSEIIPIGPVDNVQELADEIGCGIGSLPSYYLGLPLGAKHKALGVWDTVEDKFRKRLSSWKSQYISKGGRLTLIQSTLSSLPIYCLSLFRMPVSIATRLEKIQREFLWSGDSLARKTHLVNWKTVCTAKKKGGLGLRRFSILNKALLCKWCWRFATERDSLWRKVICSKFGEDFGGWCSGDINGGFGVGLWKEIRKEWPQLVQNTYLALGNGRRISFWKDVWCGEEALSLTFPNLFRMTAQKDAKVADLWNWDSGEGGWNPIFLRSFNDWELEEGVRFLQVLYRTQISPLKEDKIIFKGSRNDVFSVSSMCRVLDRSPQVAFPYRIIWNPALPPRLRFFGWEASWGKVLTLDQLKRRGRALANRCFLCEEDEEDINHLLLHCIKARMLWDLLFAIVGTSWVAPETVNQMLLSWQGTPMGKKRIKIWNAAPICLFWTVWFNRNMLVFENRATSDQRTKFLFLSNLWTLAKTHTGEKMYSLVDFLTWFGSR